MEENKVATDSSAAQPVLCKACGKQVPDDMREAVTKGRGWIVYCSYECYCDD